MRGAELFVVLACIHFAIDWICQSHDVAMRKSNDAAVRAYHCLIYTCGFMPFLIWLQWRPWQWWVASQILFWSHFVEDTYLPVYWWALHIRQVPMVVEHGKVGFATWAREPLGILLIIVVDQIVHLAFLWLVVALAQWS